MVPDIQAQIDQKIREIQTVIAKVVSVQGAVTRNKDPAMTEPEAQKGPRDDCGDIEPDSHGKYKVLPTTLDQEIDEEIVNLERDVCEAAGKTRLANQVRMTQNIGSIQKTLMELVP